MRRLFSTLLIVLLNTSLIGAQTALPKKVIKSVRTDKSKALRDIAKSLSPVKTIGEAREIPLRPSPLSYDDKKKSFLGPDTAWQNTQGNLKTAVPVENFEGPIFSFEYTFGYLANILSKRSSLVDSSNFRRLMYGVLYLQMYIKSLGQG